MSTPKENSNSNNLNPSPPSLTNESILVLWSSMGWFLATACLLVPTIYNLILHMLVLVGTATLLTSSNVRKIASEFPMEVFSAHFHKFFANKPATAVVTTLNNNNNGGNNNTSTSTSSSTTKQDPG